VSFKLAAAELGVTLTDQSPDQASRETLWAALASLGGASQAMRQRLRGWRLGRRF